MSFRLPFSEDSSWPFGRLVVIALILMHVGWICTHLWLVSNNQINPWKLGGYGMYTTADPKPVIQVYDMRFGGQVMSPESIRVDRFVAKNARLAFRCKHITEDSMRMLAVDNQHLAGVPLQLAVLELSLKRDPIRQEWGPSTVLGIMWASQHGIVYEAETCGEEYRGRIEAVVK